MKVAFKPSAIKKLGRLPEKIQRSILEKIETLAPTRICMDA